MKLERLAEWPHFGRERFDNRAFVVKEDMSEWSILAKLKVLTPGPVVSSTKPYTVTDIVCRTASFS